MKFQSTSVSLLLTATSVATASIHQIAKAATDHRSTASFATSHFGMIEKSLKPAFHLIPRGGATLVNSDDEESAEKDKENSNSNNDNDVPPTLYLPGLVDAKVAKKNVSVL